MNSRILATVREYDELIKALREWMAELGTTGEAVDYAAGVPDGYTTKLFSPIPMKGIGRHSMGPILGALGLKLMVAVDEEALARMRPRLKPAIFQRWHTNDGIATERKHEHAGNSEWGRIMRARGMLLISPKRRREIGRTNIAKRWAKRAKP